MMLNSYGNVCCITGSKYLEYKPASELNFLLVKMNNESQIEQNNLMNSEQKSKTNNELIDNNNNTRW